MYAVGTGDPLKVSPPGNEVIRDVLQEEVSQRGIKSTAEGSWEAAAAAPSLRAGPLQHPLTLSCTLDMGMELGINE